MQAPAGLLTAQSASDLRIIGSGSAAQTMTRVLAERFEANTLYTWVGEGVLLSINPYADLGLNTDAMMSTYRKYRKAHNSTRVQVKSLTGELQTGDTLPPHIFAVAERAWQLLRKVGDQCILVSGDTGSGKSLASSLIIRYFATGTPWQQLKRSAEPEAIMDGMMLLDSYGSAEVGLSPRTTCYLAMVDMEFDSRSIPVGGSIDLAWLDGSRLTKPETPAFHIFYEFLAGATDAVLRRNHLLSRDSSDYRYLRFHSHVYQPEKVTELAAANFKKMHAYCISMGIQLYQTDFFYSIIAALLHLGNISFPLSRLDPSVMSAVRLLSLNADAFYKCLTENGTSEEAARPIIDALANYIYERLFRHIVSCINALGQSPSEENRNGRSILGSICVVDFPGYMVKKTQGHDYTQLCINYTNERIHHLCQQITVAAEQQLHEREGVPWKYVEFFDNTLICHAFEKYIFPLLSLRDVETFALSVAESPAALQGVIDVSSNDGGQTFLVSHFSGEERYSTEAVVNNCRGTKCNISEDLMDLLLHSSDEMTVSMFTRDASLPSITGTISKVKSAYVERLKLSCDTAESDLVQLPAENSDMHCVHSTQRLVTIAGRRTCHVIRCLHSNDNNQPMHFNNEVVENQIINYDIPSVLQVCQQRQNHYEIRFPYALFLKRYRLICPHTWPRYSHLSEMEATIMIIKHAEMHPSEFALGFTMIFLKNTSKLDFLRNAALHRLATQLQTFMRGAMVRMRYIQMRQAARKIQLNWRIFYCKKKLAWYREAFIAWLVHSKQGGMNAVRNSWKNDFFTPDELVRIRNNNAEERAAIKIQRMFRRELACRICLVIRRSFLTAPRSGVVPGRCYTVVGWPIAEIPWVEQAVNCIKTVFKNWCNYHYRRQITPQLEEFMQLKAVAQEMFRGKKAGYINSVPKSFQAIHFNISDHKFKPTWDELFRKENIIFANIVIKINRSDFKRGPRVLVLTNWAVFVLDMNFKVKNTIPFDAIHGVSVSPFTDNLFVLHLDLKELPQLEQKKGDFLFMSDCVIEFITKLSLQYEKATRFNCKLTVADKVTMNSKNGTSQIVFKIDTDVQTPVLNVEKNKTLHVLCPSQDAELLLKARKAVQSAMMTSPEATKAVHRSLTRQVSAPPVEVSGDLDGLNAQQFARFMETGTLPRNFSFRGVKPKKGQAQGGSALREDWSDSSQSMPNLM